MELIKMLGYELESTREEVASKGNFIYTKVIETWRNKITRIWVELYYIKDFERIEDTERILDLLGGMK